MCTTFGLGGNGTTDSGAIPFATWSVPGFSCSIGDKTVGSFTGSGVPTDTSLRITIQTLASGANYQVTFNDNFSTPFTVAYNIFIDPTAPAPAAPGTVINTVVLDENAPAIGATGTVTKTITTGGFSGPVVGTLSITPSAKPASLSTNTTSLFISETYSGVGVVSISNSFVQVTPTTPPPSGTCTTAAAAVVFPTDAVPENAFLVRYAANLDQGDSFVNITNTGLNGVALLGPGFGGQVGNLCVNVYTFSPDEQLVSCCSCLVTPNGLASLSVKNDLLNTTLTGVVPTSVIVKLVASLPGTNAVAGGMLAWGTTLHQTPTGTFGVAETPFRSGTLRAAELASIRGRCASILGNGSGFGVCRSCRTGALGAAKLQ